MKTRKRYIQFMMVFVGMFALASALTMPAHADNNLFSTNFKGETVGANPEEWISEEPCPPGTLLEPYTGVCAPINDLQTQFEKREKPSIIQSPPSLIELRKQSTLRRKLRNKFIPLPEEGEDIVVPGGIGAGITYKVGSLQTLEHSELHTKMFVYPDGVNPSPPGLTWLFSTATNRTHRGVEVVGIYSDSNTGSLGVFDWSCSTDYPCEGGETEGSWVWTSKFSNFPCNVTEMVDKGGHLQKVMQYNNKTVKLDQGNPPLWLNEVYLWNFCNEEWDLVYEHEYRYDQTDCSIVNSCGWWGPILETFDDPLPKINELGFEDTLLYHDGLWSELPPAETDFTNPFPPWYLFHLDPNRGFGVGNYPEGLQNGDFEQGVASTVAYWIVDSWKPGVPIMIWEPLGEGYQGSRSVSIEHTEENDSRWIQVVTGLTPDADYRLSGLIKGQNIVNVTGTIGANLCLFGTWEHTPGISGNFDWTDVSMTFTAPEDGFVVIGCRLGHNGSTTTGKAWFDNIILTLKFTDVPPGHWAETAIYKIYNAGITQGCSPNPLKFCPDVVTNREQMAVFLGRSIHGSEFTPPDATGIFADVSLGHWAADWIEQAYNDGITKGCSTNPLRYCPTVNVTRAQMAVFLLRAKHGGSYTPLEAAGIFSDVDLSHWSADWIEQLYNEGITVGCGTDPLRFCPDASVTRAQMAVFLMRTFGL